MCTKSTGECNAGTKNEAVHDVESRERLIQAKRLWNLRWCCNWYNKKCELEERLYRRRQVDHRDMLLTSNMNLCVIQQILDVASAGSDGSDDLYGISETEEQVATDETSHPPGYLPVGKKKYKLLKTPLHYIRALKNKVSRSRRRHEDTGILNEGDFPFSSQTKQSFREEYEQRCAMPTRFNTSCDLIDFVSSSRDSRKCGLLALQCPACHIQQVTRAMGLNMQSPRGNDGSGHLLRAEWKEPLSGETVFYVGDVTATEKFPRAAVLRLLAETMHSPLCVCSIIRTIVRSVINSHLFHFLKRYKELNDLDCNFTTVSRNIENNMSYMSTGRRRELHSSPSCPTQQQLHSYMMANNNYGVGKMVSSTCGRVGYGGQRQSAVLPTLVNIPWHRREHMVTAGSSRPPEYASAHPPPCYATGSHIVATAHDPQKSKTL